MHFDDFTTPAVPGDIDTYKAYRRLTMEFLEARNRRIDRWVLDHPRQTLDTRGQECRAIGDSAARRSPSLPN